jgi:hypothetical protein
MKSKGTITPALLVITGTFLIVIYSLLILLSMQLDFSQRQISSETAFNVAEAGVEYYKWHLLEDPTDFQDNTGSDGPYVHSIKTASGVDATFSLDIKTNIDKSIITLSSTAWVNNSPNIKRTIKAVYGRTPLTRYSFFHNSPIWFGNEVTLDGPVFSNGPIRMDGTNTSTVQSAVESYICGDETGCSSPTEKPGIWGIGGPQELWQFPVPQADFDTINVDFNYMRNQAQSTGVYLPPSGKQGYHIIFDSGGNFNVYEVNVTQSFKGYSEEYGCENLFEDIKNETLIATYSVSEAPIIFSEDTIWVDGTLNGKTTIVAARFPFDTNNADIWILNNLLYVDKSGNSRLGLIAQRDVIMGKDVPEFFEIDAAMLTQKGRVIRHHYNMQKCKNSGDTQRKQLIIYGSIISNLRSYWNFSGGPGVPASGFQETQIIYDTHMFNDPPEYFPNYGNFRLLSWTEE